MSLRKAVYSLLSGLESDSFPLTAQQATTDPYIVYTMRSEPFRSQDGIPMRDVDLSLSIYASSFSDCIALADTIYAGMEGTSGTYATETLHVTNWISEDENYLDDLEKYVITQEYQLRFY